MVMKYEGPIHKGLRVKLNEAEMAKLIRKLGGPPNTGLPIGTPWQEGRGAVQSVPRFQLLTATVQVLWDGNDEPTTIPCNLLERA
jgi:hypothetical protein